MYNRDRKPCLWACGLCACLWAVLTAASFTRTFHLLRVVYSHKLFTSSADLPIFSAIKHAANESKLCKTHCCNGIYSNRDNLVASSNSYSCESYSHTTRRLFEAVWTVLNSIVNSTSILGISMLAEPQAKTGNILTKSFIARYLWWYLYDCISASERRLRFIEQVAGLETRRQQRPAIGAVFSEPVPR